MNDKNLTLGVVFSLLSFLSLAVMNALGKVAGGYEPVALIVFIQNIVSFILILPFAFYQGLGSLKTKKIILHIARAATGAGAWYCLFVAIKMVSLQMAVLLCYAAPLWLPIFAQFFFKEKVYPKVWVGVVIGFIGIMCVLGVNQVKNLSSVGLVLGVVAGICLAFALISVKLLNKTEGKTTILFYYFLLSALIFLPLAAPQFSSMKLQALPYLLGIGICLSLSQLFLVLAYSFASAVKLSPYIYSVIIFSALIDWIVWHTPITPFEWFGIALVVIGGVFAMKVKQIEKPI